MSKEKEEEEEEIAPRKDDTVDCPELLIVYYILFLIGHERYHLILFYCTVHNTKLIISVQCEEIISQSVFSGVIAKVVRSLATNVSS